MAHYKCRLLGVSLVRLGEKLLPGAERDEDTLVYNISTGQNVVRLLKALDLLQICFRASCTTNVQQFNASGTKA